jgi:hypothetical protein
MNATALRRNLSKASVKLRYKILFDSVDKTDLLVSLGTIRRDVNLSTGTALVTFNNSGGWWNFLHQTNVALRDTVEIQVYVDGDAANVLTLFSGTCWYPKFEGSNVTITVKDHSGSFLDRKVGSNESPYTFWQAQGHTVDAVVWRMLTHADLGNLDGLNGPANTDIDYGSFARWRDVHIIPNDYEVKGMPKGQTIGQLLMILCQMSHSYIWINNDGKFEFAPPYEPGYSYSEGNTGKRGKPGHGRELVIRDDLIINDITVGYGHNFTLGSWVAFVNDTDATSIAKYGLSPKTIEGRIFAHQTVESATSDRDATLVDYAYPLRFLTLTPGFPAIMEDLGRHIAVSDTLKEISNQSAETEQINYDLDTWEITIKARWPWP